MTQMQHTGELSYATHKEKRKPDAELDNLRGLLWALFSVVVASMMTAIVRALSEFGMGSTAIVLWRGLVLTIAVIFLFAVPKYRKFIRFTNIRLHLVRGTLIGISIQFGYYTIANLPLATSTVLFFTAPIFATMLAGPINGEQVGARRWAAVIAGFIGALIILRPGIHGLEFAMLTALLSSAFFAAALVMSRGLATQDGAISTFTSSAVMTLVITLLVAPFDGTFATFTIPTELLIISLILVMTLTAGLRNVADIQSYRYAEASLVGITSYLRLLVLAFLGWVIFGEIPDLPTILGGLVIVASTIYIAHRERLTSKRAKQFDPARQPVAGAE